MPTYDFAGIADGSPWPSPWVKALPSGSTGDVYVQSGHGVLKTGNVGGYSSTDRPYVNHGSANVADAEVVFTLWGDAGGSRSVYLCLRNAGALPASATRIEVRAEWNGVTVREGTGDTRTDVGTKIAGSPFDAPTKIRARLSGTNIKVRVWPAGNAEPSTWDRDLTLTTVTAAGVIGFYALGSNAAAYQYAHIDDVTITDLAAPAPTVTVTAPSTASGRVNVAFASFTVTSSTSDGATVTYTAASLPPGLTLNSSTGAVTGTPATAGTYSTTFTGTGSTGGVGTASTTFTINPASSVTLTAPSTASGRVGTPISSFTLTSSTNDGGTVTYSASGLPPGVSLNSTTGVVSGTPTTVGTPTTTFTATSSTGPTATKQTAWTVTAAPTVTLTAPATATGQVGTVIAGFTLSSSTNDAAAVTYSAITLPPGLNLNSTTGAITGTPTTAGTYTTSFTATSASGPTDTKQTTFTINPVPAVTLTVPASVSARVGSAVSVQAQSTTNDGAAVTYTVNTLPAGLTLDGGTGVVSGTPTTTGNTTTTWTATSASGATATGSTAWTVQQASYEPPVRRWAAPSSGWEYFATTVRGDGTEVLLASSLPLTGVSITDPVSASPELSFDLTPEIRRLQQPDGRPIIRARSTAVYAALGGQLRCGGIVNRTSAEGQSLKVVCSGFVSLIDGEPWTNTTIKYVGADPADVARTIWRYWQAHPLANVALEIPTDVHTSVKVGTVEEPVLLANYATADLGELFFDMLEAGSIDFRERHWWDGDTIRHRLDMGYPRLGRRRTDLSFRIGTNTLVPTVGFDQERYASEVLVLGAGEGDKMVRAHAYNPDADRLRRCKALPSKGIGRTPTAELFANKWVRNFNGDERDVEELVVIDHQTAPLFSWDPGDEVWLAGDSMWGGRVGMWVRVLSTTITPDKTATAQLKVARADKAI